MIMQIRPRTLVMAKLRSVLVDLSGTLHVENNITSDAVNALNRLRQSHLNVKFVTNTTKESRRSLYERLRKLGFHIREDEIYSSLWAARDYVTKKNFKPLLLLDDDALEDFSGLTNFENKPDSVLIGLAPKHFNRSTLNNAFRILIDGGQLVATHKSKYYKKTDGLALGPGAFVTCLEYATGKEAVVIGKPSEAFFKGALSGVLPAEAVMIGDDVQDDIGGAQKLGIRGYLVKTGKYRKNDENKIDPPPFKCVDTFSSAVEDILSNL